MDNECQKHFDSIICLTGQPGDVLSPVPSLVEDGDYYEYIWRIKFDRKHCFTDRNHSESEK